MHRARGWRFSLLLPAPAGLGTSSLAFHSDTSEENGGEREQLCCPGVIRPMGQFSSRGGNQMTMRVGILSERDAAKQKNQ